MRVCVGGMDGSCVWVVWVCGRVVCVHVCGWVVCACMWVCGMGVCVGGWGSCVWVFVCACGCGCMGGGVVRVGRVCMRIYVCMHDWMRGVERRRERLKFLVMTFFIFLTRLSNPCSRQDKGGSANGWTGMKLCQFWVEIKH